MADPESGHLPVNPYDAVLADLRAKRDHLDHVIRTLEAYRAGAPSDAIAKSEPTNVSFTPVLGPGAFLGMNIVDATKALLASRRQAMSNPDIAAALKAGGLAMNSREPANTVGSVLTRRFEKTGDVVRVNRGTWGLAEWYPNRNFRKKIVDISDMPGGHPREAPAVGHSKGEPPPIPDVFK